MADSVLDDKRPIYVAWILGGDNECFSVGSFECTKIEAYGEPGPHCYVPFIAIYKDDEIVRRIPATGVMIQYESDEVTP